MAAATRVSVVDTQALAVDMPASAVGMPAAQAIPSAVRVPLPASPEAFHLHPELVSLALICITDFADPTVFIIAAGRDGDSAVGRDSAIIVGASDAGVTRGTAPDTTIRGCGIGGTPIRPTIRTTTTISPLPTR